MDDLIGKETVGHAEASVAHKRRYTVPTKDDYLRELTALKIEHKRLERDLDAALYNERTAVRKASDADKRYDTALSQWHRHTIIARWAVVVMFVIGALCGWAVCHG